MEFMNTIRRTNENFTASPFSCRQQGAGEQALPRVLYLAVLFCLLFLGGCGSLTGIPGHGGGKRFAIEQELVAATTRATIKQIDLTSIKGKKVNLFVNAIGDTGTGNLLGGRLSVVSQLRGDYIHSPAVTERSVYPRYTTNSSSTAASTSSTSTSDTLLNSPEYNVSQQKGGGSEMQIGVEYEGLGSYQNSEEISSDDLQYLSGLLQTYLFLQGVYVVPPSEAEVDVYVTVDVFGTVRTRVDWFLANNEILRAKTNLEVMAIDHQTGKLVMPPQSAASEAEYNEQYVLWAGPVTIKKYLKPGEELLSDFTDLQNENLELAEVKMQEEVVPYPFQHEIEMRDEGKMR
jgi:hypothetical protein